MKKPFHVLGIVILAAILGGCQNTAERSSSATANDGRVQVSFENPEQFTDVSSSYKGRVDQGYLAALRSFIDREARRYLAPNQTLALTFRDIDLAGDFEPWRGPNATDVRMVRSIYPPRLKFDYTVTNANGEIVRQGHESLTDLTFDWRLHLPDRSDPVYYEKALLRDWMARALR